MKYLMIALAALVSPRMTAQHSLITTKELSPLSAYSTEWNKQEYRNCNTAENVNYLTGKEKEVIYILNLARTYPKLFASSVLGKYLSVSGKRHLLNDQVYYQSLVNKMQSMNPAPLLAANEKCFISASCHATASGKSGYTGHTRESNECKTLQHFMGECCDYGNEEPIDIILTLLIDENIPSLGHRKILLGNYSSVGVSIKPHKTYRQNTVLDFYK